MQEKDGVFQAVLLRMWERIAANGKVVDKEMKSVAWQRLLVRHVVAEKRRQMARFRPRGAKRARAARPAQAADPNGPRLHDVADDHAEVLSKSHAEALHAAARHPNFRAAGRAISQPRSTLISRAFAGCRRIRNELNRRRRNRRS